MAGLVALMAATGIIGCRGLHSDPSPVSPPPGGMRICDEVVIDAPGVATCRPGFTTLQLKSAAHRPLYLTAFDGGVVVVARDPDGETWRIETLDAVLTGSPAPPDWARSGTQFAQARGRLYLTTHDGVQALAAIDAAGIEGAGLHAVGQPIPTIDSGPGDWLPSASAAAYRVTIRRSSGTFEARSAPSPYTLAVNEGAASAVSLRVPLPTYAEEGDTVEVWRSVVSPTALPADQMYLALRHVLTSGDVSTGWVDIDDGVEEEALGELLYTSSTREGIEGANEPPPRAAALAAWQDSLWAGATQGPQTLVVDLEVPVGPAPELAGGSVTASSPVFTAAGSTVDVRPGQRVISAGVFPDGTYVESVVGSAVTMTEDALVTDAAADITLADVITIDGVEYYAKASGSLDLAAREFVWESAIDGADAAYKNARFLAVLVSLSGDLYAHAVLDPAALSSLEAPHARLVIRRASQGVTTAIAFSSTLPDETWGYPLGPASLQDVRPNRVAFSKPLEPEHFRALDWMELGREDAAVLAFAPLRDGILVFKEDGIWSVYGTWPLFSAEQLSEARLIGGHSVDVLDGIAYARTDRGVLAVTSAGVARRISEGRIRDELAPYMARYQAYVRAWPTLGVVLVSTGNGGGPAPAAVYCLHVGTGEWSRWTTPAVGMAWDPARSSMVAAWGVDRWELREAVGARGYDATHTITAWTIAGTTDEPLETEDNEPLETEGGEVITVAVASDARDVIAILTGDLDTWVPEVGDVVEVGGVAARVVAVTLDGGAYLLELDRELPEGAEELDLTAYESVIGRLEWQRHGVSQPSTGGFVREMQVHLDQADAGASPFDAMRLIAGGASDLAAARHTLIATPALAALRSRPVRFGVSRQIGRSTHLYPYVAIAELYRWRVLGIALVGDPTTTRVRR